MTTREVVLEGGLPWGFRMHGGVDVGQPLKIYRVNPGSKASQSGIREGDLISSINGQQAENLTNTQAHSLLKTSGNILKLGLNKNTDYSPKKQQYKTILQETHEETIKKSSYSTYSIEKTVESTGKNNNEYSASKNRQTYATANGKPKNSRTSGIESQKSTPSSSTLSTSSTLIGEATSLRSISSDKATIASPRSPYSNCTTLSNQSSIADEGVSSHQDTIFGEEAMNHSSKSKKRRQRRKNLKNNQSQKTTCDNIKDITNESTIQIAKSSAKYKVESPKELKNPTTADKDIKKLKAKSKSLDDDDLIKIQELSETSDTEHKKDSTHPIVVTETSESEEDFLDPESPSITPEEEETLRNFLNGLKLINSPEAAAKEVYDNIATESKEDIRAKKAQKRKELEEYFFPHCQNPRYLDAISEETSDMSDKENQNQQNSAAQLKRSTPEIDLRPAVPPRSRKAQKKQEAQPVLLVDTKIVVSAPEEISAEGICEVKTIDQPLLSVETVFLNDSSNSSSVDQESRKSSLSDALENLSTNSSTPVDLQESTSSSLSELTITEQSEQNDLLHKDIEADVRNVKENFTESRSEDDNKIGHTTTIVASKFASTTKIIRPIEDNKTFDSCILNQLTPPPTPDQTTPENGLIEPTSINKTAVEQDQCEKLTENATILPKDQVESPTTQKEIEKLTENLQVLPSQTNVLSPVCPSSVSEDSCSSHEGSQCTAKYNPNSSIADVLSLIQEEELNKQLYQPLTLREIVLKFFITLPFGAEVLQELAEVSKSIESYTNQLPQKYLPRITSALVNRATPCSDDNNKSFSDLSVNSLPKMPSSSEQNVSKEKWTGLPVDHNPSILLCLSPTQKEELNKNRKAPNEAQKLLELHEKFVNRKVHHEEIRNHVEDNRVTISSIHKSHISANITPSVKNRGLTIIKEDEPLMTENNDFTKKEEKHYLYFDALDTAKDVNNSRLKAKNLDEWLQLARHKSMSESNLDSINIPINNLGAPATANILTKRRSSLPQEIYEKQLIHIMEKERQIQKELEMLEEEKRKIQSELAPSKQFNAEDFHVSKRGDFAEHKIKSRPNSMPVIPTEIFRQQMYDEYMDKFSERLDRKQHKIIKISSSHDLDNVNKESKEIIHPVMLEKEFMEKVREKNLGQGTSKAKSEEKLVTTESDKKEDEPVVVIDGTKLKISNQNLPKHLQEFVDMTKQLEDDGIWSPGLKQPEPLRNVEQLPKPILKHKDDPIQPVWTPKSANSSPVLEKKEFRPVNFQSPVFSRKTRTKSESIGTPDSTTSEPPWRSPEGFPYTSTLDRRLHTSQSSPGFPTQFSTTPRLPRAQNPTITLLQKAREGQLPKGAQYIETDTQDRKLPNDRPPIKYPGELLYNVRSEYTSESDTERPRKMADLTPRKFEGIGPTTKDGMPMVLRSEIKEKDQSKWYKRMYDTIHKQRPHKDEYVTVRYKQKRAQYPYSSGYLSEPEPGAYDSDFTEYKYSTLDRRREAPVQQYTTSTMPRNVPEKSYSSSEIPKTYQDSYRTPPGKIENYRPGHSSISEKEAKQWWDEVMDIFDGHLEQQKHVPTQPRSFINQALKESGYESDSTLVFRRREEAASQLSPKEQKAAYKVIQKGGDVPFQGLRKPAPERPKEPEIPPPPPPKDHNHPRSQEQESPRKYLENEVTIHYKTPVRQEIKEYVSEDELAHRQAEAMKKIYQEERRRKYLQVSKSMQELQDMNSRRHTDNFIPSQKSPISLNRYDDFDDLAPSKTLRPRSPEPRLIAKALYNFVGQTARELTFRKGDLIYVRRQIDKNWYEGELNAMIGLFPTNYVEIVPYETPKTTTPRKSHEGQARAKYNFLAQTHLELSLAKGELVTLTRKIDDNWFEGKIGGRKGIFPVSYVDVLIDPQTPPAVSTKPVAAPAAHSLLLNGSAQGKESMGSHLYTPSLPNPELATSYRAKPVHVTDSNIVNGRLGKNPLDQALHIETQSEPIPFRALYKYTPQNDDELELLEGDTVYVLEKCDDGWFVGSSERTGAFGTFPGNYVEKI